MPSGSAWTHLTKGVMASHLTHPRAQPEWRLVLVLDKARLEGRVYSRHSDAHYTVFLHFLTQPWTMWSLSPHSRPLNTS